MEISDLMKKNAQLSKYLKICTLMGNVMGVFMTLFITQAIDYVCR